MNVFRKLPVGGHPSVWPFEQSTNFVPSSNLTPTLGTAAAASSPFQYAPRYQPHLVGARVEKILSFDQLWRTPSPPCQNFPRSAPNLLFDGKCECEGGKWTRLRFFSPADTASRRGGIQGGAKIGSKHKTFRSHGRPRLTKIWGTKTFSDHTEHD